MDDDLRARCYGSWRGSRYVVCCILCVCHSLIALLTVSTELSISDEFEVSQGNFIGNVDISADYVHVELEVRIREWNGQTTNILLCGKDQDYAQNIYAQLSAYPFSLFHRRHDGKSYFEIELQYNGGTDSRLHFEDIERNRWYRLEIEQSGDYVTGTLDGEEQWTKPFYGDQDNRVDRKTFLNVPCYASTPNKAESEFARPAIATVRNLIIKSMITGTIYVLSLSLCNQ